jgi:D-arginine dehydrogenase
MNQASVDVVVVGAGIAGASVAAELARTHSVVVIEREAAPGYHATGRSAAIFSEAYGNAPVRALSRASRAFFTAPPQGFSDYPLITPRGALQVARADQAGTLSAVLDNADASQRAVDCDEALRLSPLLRPEAAAAGGVYEPHAADIDVNALHQGYLRLLRHRGGAVHTDAEVTALSCADGIWSVTTGSEVHRAPVVINAAGAWADHLAALAGIAPLHIQPCRRTAILVELPEGVDAARSPLTLAIDESFYFKPDAGLLLISPADETPVGPCDIQPEELDVAVAIDRVEQATNVIVRRVRRKWAGLRSFAPDRTPVVGFDPAAPGFFWLAGQGGYGIQTAPAMSSLAAALVRGEALPASLDGFDPKAVSPARFGARA